jgi:putative transposase
MQQLQEAIPTDHDYRFLLHDRHATFSARLDLAVQNLGIAALETPIRTPQANALCERSIGTIQRECLDFMIPRNERHVRMNLREWFSHNNQGCPHSSLGPGIPDRRVAPPPRMHRHRLEPGEQGVSTAILGGLHHEYVLEKTAT